MVVLFGDRTTDG